MKLSMLIAVAFAVGLHGCSDGERTGSSVETETPKVVSDGSLVDEWYGYNESCRGGSTDSADTIAACDRRDALTKTLNGKGWCYGKEDQAGNEEDWHRCNSGSSGNAADLSSVRGWSCNGASGPFEMTFRNVDTAPWGNWGDVLYSPSSPFGFEGDDGFAYERESSTITIGQNPEIGEEGIEFKIDAARSEIFFLSTYSGDSIICKPA